VALHNAPARQSTRHLRPRISGDNVTISNPNCCGRKATSRQRLFYQHRQLYPTCPFEARFSARRSNGALTRNLRNLLLLLSGKISLDVAECSHARKESRQGRRRRRHMSSGNPDGRRHGTLLDWTPSVGRSAHTTHDVAERSHCTRTAARAGGELKPSANPDGRRLGTRLDCTPTVWRNAHTPHEKQQVPEEGRSLLAEAVSTDGLLESRGPVPRPPHPLK